jgi:hypothetical protein
MANIEKNSLSSRPSRLISDRMAASPVMLMLKVPASKAVQLQASVDLVEISALASCALVSCDVLVRVTMICWTVGTYAEHIEVRKGVFTGASDE